MYKQIWFLTLSLGFSGMTAVADMPTALTHFDKKEYAEAFVEFKRMAELGDDQARRNLVAMYFNGQGIERNKVAALAWARLMAEDSPAYVEWVNLYKQIDGKVSASERQSAETLFTQLRDEFGRATLEMTLLPELKEEHNSIYDVELPERAQPIRTVPPEYPAGLMRAGRCGTVVFNFYINSSGTPQGIKVVSLKGDEKFKESALKAIKKWSFTPAMDYLAQTKKKTFSLDFKVQGTCKIEDPVVNKAEKEEKTITLSAAYINKLKVVPYYKTAEEKHRYAQEGVAAAQYEYAQFMEMSLSSRQSKVKQNVVAKQATELFLRAAVGGETRAQLALARRLEAGCGCSADYMKSRNWYEIAAKSGSSDAKVGLAQLLSKSPDERDRERSLALLNELIEEGAKGEGGESWVNSDAVRLLVLQYIESNNFSSLETLLEKLPKNDPATHDLYSRWAEKIGDKQKATEYQRAAIALFDDTSGAPEIFTKRLEGLTQ